MGNCPARSSCSPEKSFFATFYFVVNRSPADAGNFFVRDIYVKLILIRKIVPNAHSVLSLTARLL